MPCGRRAKSILVRTEMLCSLFHVSQMNEDAGLTFSVSNVFWRLDPKGDLLNAPALRVGSPCAMGVPQELDGVVHPNEKRMI